MGRRIVTAHRLSQGAFVRPTTAQSIADTGVSDRQALRPFHHCLGNAIKRKHPIVSGVVHLLLARSPHAILSRVAERIIDTFKRVVVRGSVAHIGQEHEKITPLRTRGNTSIAVVARIFGVGVVGSGSHCFPDTIHRSAGKPVGSRRTTSFTRFNLKAPARFSRLVFCSNILQGNNFGTSTRATEHPELMAAFSAMMKLNSSKPAVLVALLYNGFSHIATRFSNVIRGRVFQHPVPVLYRIPHGSI